MKVPGSVGRRVIQVRDGAYSAYDLQVQTRVNTDGRLVMGISTHSRFAARRSTHSIRSALLVLLAGTCLGPALAQGQTPDPSHSPPPACNSDAMLVFDGSGSMAGNERLGIGSVVTRIDKVRKALDRVLPAVAPLRRLGLMTYGPGPYNRCDNIELNVRPSENAAGPINEAVDAIVPAGRTPLTEAVRQAAEVLEYKTKPGVVVLLTDGEETCGGKPCALARRLEAEAADLTIHVIGYRMKDFSWTGGAGLLDMKCLAESTGGTYETVETVDELIASLAKTLGCPELTDMVPPSRIKFAGRDASQCPMARAR